MEGNFNCSIQCTGNRHTVSVSTCTANPKTVVCMSVHFPQNKQSQIDFQRNIEQCGGRANKIWSFEIARAALKICLTPPSMKKTCIE